MYTERKDNETGQVESIVRKSDNAVIPVDPQNMDYQEYLRWKDSSKK